MAFQHGKSVFVMFNGYNLTGYLNKIETPATAETAETSVFGVSNKTFVPGLKDATMTAEGLYDGAVSAVDAILSGIFTGLNISNNMIWFPGGNVVGNRGYAMSLIQTAYNATGTKDDAVKINVAGQSNVARERAVLIKAHASIAATGDGASSNAGADSSNGGSVYLEASAVTGTLDVIVEHSTTGAFAGEETTLATFTQLTALGHERIVIPITTTIKQYTRASYTIATGPAVFAVALCRG